MGEASLLSDEEIREFQELMSTGIAGRDRDTRKSRRFPYPVRHMVTPIVGGSEAAEMSREVLCRDISQGGIAFHWPSQPDFSDAVVALDKDGQTMRILLRVVHRQSLQDGTMGYLVGCQFVKRLPSRPPSGQ
jgi:hypothetical protein